MQACVLHVNKRKRFKLAIKINCVNSSILGHVPTKSFLDWQHYSVATSALSTLCAFPHKIFLLELFVSRDKHMQIFQLKANQLIAITNFFLNMKKIAFLILTAFIVSTKGGETFWSIHLLWRNTDLLATFFLAANVLLTIIVCMLAVLVHFISHEIIDNNRSTAACAGQVYSDTTIKQQLLSGLHSSDRSSVQLSDEEEPEMDFEWISMQEIKSKCNFQLSDVPTLAM